jgi:hypothetical protein
MCTKPNVNAVIYERGYDSGVKMFRYIGQAEARQRKYKRLKLGGGHVYDRSSV